MTENTEHTAQELEAEALRQARELLMVGIGAASLLKDRASALTRELERRGEQVVGAKGVENTPLHRQKESGESSEDSEEKKSADDLKGGNGHEQD